MSTETLTEAMTVRLIDADELEKQMRRAEPPMANLPMLRAMPTIDAPSGTWKRIGLYWMECSECKTYLPRNEWEKYVWNFCPVCGADMRGGSDGRGKT